MHKVVKHTMSDRFTKGFFAGIIGGIITNAFSFFEGALNLTTVRTMDLIGIVIFAHTPPFSIAELVFAFIGHVFISGVIGIAFAYFILLVTNQALWLKGTVFSIQIWFWVYAATTAARLPGTVPTPLNTAVSDAVNAIIFGLALTYFLEWLFAKEKSISIPGQAIPAMKPLHQKDEDK